MQLYLLHNYTDCISKKAFAVEVSNLGTATHLVDSVEWESWGQRSTSRYIHWKNSVCRVRVHVLMLAIDHLIHTLQYVCTCTLISLHA
jgi:hypothetical protein